MPKTSSSNNISMAQVKSDLVMASYAIKEAEATSVKLSKTFK